MSYALVHYPDIDTTAIDRLRRNYDPQAALIAPHITLVFPLPDSLDESRLVSHIAEVIDRWKPFPIRLQGLVRSLDDYLYLTTSEGTEDIVRLHDELYVGILADYLRDDIPYIPHVTLGAFSGMLETFARAFTEAETENMDYRPMVNRVNLVRVNDERTALVSSRTFELRDRDSG